MSPNRFYIDKVDITGRAAHLTAAATGGPRHDPSLTTAQRRGAGNGIWLCADCADLIDKNEGAGFSVELLRGWKRRAEEELLTAAQLRARAARPVWIDKITTPHYLNVPRILHMTGVDAVSASTRSATSGGYPRGRSIGDELLETRRALQLSNIVAVDVSELTRPGDQLVEGMVLSFRETCRTRNASGEKEDVETFSPERSPLIYFDSWGFRYFHPYDPIWVTTSTAQATMREGVVTLAGISIIKVIRSKERQVICTPLVLGVPDILGWFT